LTQALATIGVRLVVDLSDARVYSYWGDQQLASYPVAVGQPGWETPTGEFKIANKQRNPVWKQPITGDAIPTGPDNPLGDRWIGFWSDGRHEIGFHGTNNETLIGQAVSHGCLRMRNADIRSLYEQVSEGTTVIVRD
jgi:lipoprotein-anchoring transpeptidase ErfK/SrfK